MPSQSQLLNIQCPKCGDPQQFTYWVKILASEDAHLKQLLIDDKLMTHTCASCECSFTVRGDLRYSDPPRELYIYLRPDGPYASDPAVEQTLDKMKQVLAHVHAVDSVEELRGLILKYDKEDI